MARKSITITITEGRDTGKCFLITEPPATVAEQWVIRAALGLGKAGVEIPPEVLQLGAPAIVYLAGTQALRLPSRLALKLADELMGWVQRVEDKLTRSLVENDIEDVLTRLKLKGEALKLTFGFFVPAAPQPSAQVQSGTSSSKP